MGAYNLSVNIDKKLFRSAFGMLEFMQTIPMWVQHPNVTYDGEWICADNPTSGQYPAIVSKFSYKSEGTAGSLAVFATIKAPDNDMNLHFLFLEPNKGQFNYYQGFDTRGGAGYYCRSRNGGVETVTTLTGQDWKLEHTFRLLYFTDQSKIDFFIDGALVATHTANVSASPFEVVSCEPNGVVRKMYLKYPKGMGIGYL